MVCCVWLHRSRIRCLISISIRSTPPLSVASVTMADKYGAPDKSDRQKGENTLKTAQQVAALMVMYCDVEEPVPVDPEEIGADPLNRGGSVPNIMVYVGQTQASCWNQLLLHFVWVHR